jgi:hypothetical protein
MSPEEYETKISELEQKVESLEEDIGYAIGIFFGVISYYEWHVWWASILVAITTMFIIHKYVSEKPFTNNENAG